jgi:chromosome segregation ATPase
MSDTGLIALVIAIISALVSIAGFFFNRRKTQAEAKSLQGSAEASAASAAERYEGMAARMAVKQESMEKQIDDLKRGRDTANNRIAQLEHEIQLTQAENVTLCAEIVEMKKEINNFKATISSVLRENGKLKEWCERLVHQIQSYGKEPEPFVVQVAK